MLFNSHEFIFAYLPVVFAFFFLLARINHRWAALWLALASVFFYGWWNPKFVSLLLGSICFNYGSGWLIGHSRPGRARTILVGSVTANLVLLAVFKYANFFIANVNAAGASLPLWNIVLPAGISFFTFTQIAFLVDAYRGIAREYDFVHYLLFVSWFPHLIAGPVIHHKQMMPQFANPQTYRPSSQSISVGLTLFTLGLFKKVMLADQFALIANPVFNSPTVQSQPMLIAAWAGALAYTLQLYFDFSGYSDMAIGLSRVFNIKLPLNFDSPYKAANIIDFWRRWHMTLSTFLRDYLYIPLGGNKKGPTRRYANLFMTMLLGGLWHGAGWNFVLWGGLHGTYLVVNHLWRKLTARTDDSRGMVAHTIGVLFTFFVVVLAWVPFRASSMASAVGIWRGMIGLNGVSLPPQLEGRFASILGAHAQFGGFFPGTSISTVGACLSIPVGLVLIWSFPNSQQWLARFHPAWEPIATPYRWQWSLSTVNGFLIGGLLAISILSMTRVSEFLYFQF